MINIDGRLLEKLDANEYYLFSILLNYGKKSRPKNAVLCSKTGWGIEKVQKVKKSLENKGVLTIESRKNKERGGKDSNCYNLTTTLASKYNGCQLSEKQIFEIQLLENQILEFQIDDFQVLENQTDYKVLKLSIIESIKLLKKESVKAHTQEIEKLKAEKELLKTKLSEAQKEKEKSSAKKEKDTPPTEEELRDSVNFDRPYKAILSQFSFQGWTKEMIEQFWRYAKIRDEKEQEKNPRFSFNESQIMEAIRMVKNMLFAYGSEVSILAIEEATPNAWATFYPKRIKTRLEREKIKQKENEQNHDTKSVNEHLDDMLNEYLSKNGGQADNSTDDAEWSEVEY